MKANGLNPHRTPINITAIGGGTGLAVLLKGLKKRTDNLSAIVTMFDSGGSSGLLRREFGFLPFGDLRQCLAALASEGRSEAALAETLNLRFPKNSTLNGHCVGNLMMAALADLHGGVEGAIAEMAAMLKTSGQVVPVTLENADLRTELLNGHILSEEAELDNRSTPLPPVKRIFLSKQLKANHKAIDAIMGADIVVFGPGDLYTSILPNLLPEGIAEAVASTSAEIVFVCNLMTKRGETDNYTGSDFAKAFWEYIKPRIPDRFIINTGTDKLSKQAIEAYSEEDATLVTCDDEQLIQWTKSIQKGDYLDAGEMAHIMRHDGEILATAVIEGIRKSSKYSTKAG